MGLLNSLTGAIGDIFGGDAIESNAAAGREAAMQQAAIARKDLEPFTKFGGGQIPGLESLMSDPWSVKNLPGYQFKLSEGLGALERSKLAQGKFFSGETARDILDYAEGLASSTYDTEFMKRFNLVNLGQSSAAGQANISANLGSSLLGSYQTQGQDVASAIGAGWGTLANLGSFMYGGSQGWFKK